MMIQKNRLFMIILFISVLSVGSVSILLNTVKAQEGQSFSATLSGKDEVPPTESNSTGTAKFQVSQNKDNDSQVSFWVNITGIKNVNQAHIHNGTAGQNGDIVATLSKGKSAKGGDSPPQIGFSGNITKGELEGPLKGKEISDLVKLMSDGASYANVHTDKYTKGAIRGQIESTSSTARKVPDAGTGTNTTSTAPEYLTLVLVLTRLRRSASTDAGTGTNTTSTVLTLYGTNTTSTSSTDAGTGTNTTSTAASTDAGTGTNTTSTAAST